MKNKIRKAIFPVAGFGTRFLPVTKTQPKEMLPVVDKPVIHYLVEEAVASGIEEIILITGRGKRAIEDYFDKSFELEHNLVEKGKHDLLREVLNIPDLAKFIYIRQPLPKGDGHAILQALNLIREDEAVAVMFGDDLVMGDQPALSQLIDVYEETGQTVIATTKVADSELKNYGVIDFEDRNANDVLDVIGFVEKPKTKEEAPSNIGVIGKYIVTYDVLRLLLEVESKGDNEIRLADAFGLALKNGINLKAKLVKGKRFDTGSKLGMLQASVEIALNREDLKADFEKYLRERLA